MIITIMLAEHIHAINMLPFIIPTPFVIEDCPLCRLLSPAITYRRRRSPRIRHDDVIFAPALSRHMPAVFPPTLFAIRPFHTPAAWLPH